MNIDKRTAYPGAAFWSPERAAPQEKPHCSVVIRAFNEEHHVGRLLEGLQKQTIAPQRLEVILVDSGSTDRTVGIARNHSARVVHVRPELFTFGYSLNQGIAAAHADLVVIASAHVYPVYPDYLERLLAPFADMKVCLTYGRQCGHSGSKFSEQQIFERWYPSESQPRQYHPFCNNANAAIRRSLWVNHPYDETLPGLEDLAWARWLMAQGYLISYVAEAEVIHIHNETPQAVYNRYRREAMAFKRIFPEEHFHFTTFLRLFASNAISDTWHAGLSGSLSRNWRSILWFRWMQFWGTYQGYRQSGPLTWRLRQTFYYPQGLTFTNDHSESPARDATRLSPIEYQEVENSKPGY